MKKHLKNRWYRGLICTASAPVAWLGRFCGHRLRHLRSQERDASGLVIILPGIESQSFMNHAIAWGLDDAGWPGTIEIDDWTTGCTLLFPYHLRGWKRNQRQAERIAQRIIQHQKQYPGSPVHLIGHSGGGAMAVLALEKLPVEHQATSAILLAPAISRGYPLTLALNRTRNGIWNFWSPFDLFFLGLGTVALGTLDGHHQVSAGLLGFIENDHSAEPVQKDQVRADPLGDGSHETDAAGVLHQVGYSRQMAKAFNLGGHFGCVNRVFVAEYVAPLIMK